VDFTLGPGNSYPHIIGAVRPAWVHLSQVLERETMAFSPWNALAEHRPMGRINRLRQAVYLASQAKRAAKSLW